MTNETETMRAKLLEAIEAWPQFDTDDEVNGGDLVDWFAGWRRETKELLGIKRKFAHSPERCPSMHYNPGDDICADCGEDLNPSTEEEPSAMMIDVRRIGDAPGIFRLHRASEPIPTGFMIYNRLLHGSEDDTMRWQRAARAAGIARHHDIQGDAVFTKPSCSNFFHSNREHVDIIWRMACDYYGVKPEDASAPAAPVSDPVAFEYFEIRPCIEMDGATTSFAVEQEFHDFIIDLDKDHKAFWTLYGMEGGIATAIGDFNSKANAHAVMNAIIAPMAKARNMIDAGHARQFSQEEIADRVIQASGILDDFINQCSNDERI